MSDVDDGAMDDASQVYDKPSAPHEHPVKTPHKIFEDAHLLKWMNRLKAEADAEREAKARSVVNRPRLRALGLASSDPEHLDEYSIEAGLDPDVVREMLSTDDGARIGLQMEAQLRSSGELDRVRAYWVIPDLLTVIKTSIASGSMSETTAAKVLDGIDKQTARVGEKTAGASRSPPPFVGTAAELISSLTDSEPSPASLPFKPPGYG